jgi:hypothetical protein
MASRPRRKRIPSKVQLQQSPPPIFHISLLLLLLAATCSSPLAVVRAEDADSEQVFTGKTAVSSASSSSPPSSTQPEEAAVLIFLCTLYAICVSIVAVGFGYFAFLEDKMMRVYLRHGHSLQSTVVSADFSRGAVAPTTTACGGASDGDNDHDHDAAHGAGAGAGAGAADCYTCGAGGAPSSDSSCVAAANAVRDHEEQQEQHHHQNSTRTPVVVKAEYNIVIEYKVDNHENYKSKVRKQVKALGSDFVKPIPPCIHVEMIEFRIDEATASPTASPSFLTRTDSHITSGTNGEHHHQHHHQQQAADRLQLKQHHQCSAITSHLIPILVLDDYPKSAIPLGHVQRACSWRYKLPTVMLVAIMLAFAWFCLLLAADVMYPTSLFSWTGGAAKDEEAILAVATTFSRGQVFMLVGFLLLGLVLLEVVCVHYLMGETLSASIRETYLEGVDQGSMSTDETTLSSGDDTYLMV